MSLREELRGSLAAHPARRLVLPDTRPSAVLVPLIERPQGITVLFIRRSTRLAAHGGQISFPGGVREPDDAGPVDTALREAGEEMQIQRAAVDVLGEMDDVLTALGFLVTPVLGWLQNPAPFVADPAEVERYFEVPLATLAAPAVFHDKGERRSGERTYTLYEYHVAGEIVWGAAARIVHDLLRRLPAVELPS